MGCHFLLQGIFLTQELNLGLLRCRQILYRLSYEGSRDIQHGVNVKINCGEWKKPDKKVYLLDSSGDLVLGTHLPMQGTQAQPLVWELATCCGATKPMSHNYWALVMQLLKSAHLRAHELPLLSSPATATEPCALTACALQQQEPRQWKAQTLQLPGNFLLNTLCLCFAPGLSRWPAVLWLAALF